MSIQKERIDPITLQQFPKKKNIQRVYYSREFDSCLFTVANTMLNALKVLLQCEFDIPSFFDFGHTKAPERKIVSCEILYSPWVIAFKNIAHSLPPTSQNVTFKYMWTFRIMDY